MRTYVVYDKRTGQVLHKHRWASIDDPNGEDTVERSPDDVLASYRGQVAREHLGVALIGSYRPRSSRNRTTSIDHESGRMVDEEAAPRRVPRAGASAARERK